MLALCLGATVLEYQHNVDNTVRQGQKRVNIPQIYEPFKRRWQTWIRMFTGMLNSFGYANPTEA